MTQLPSDPATRERLASLSVVFAPRSVAIVGASDTVTKIGGIPLDFLKRLGFEGGIHPINPRGGLVQGLPAFASLRELGAPVDMAICAVPAQQVDATLDDAIAAGVRALVLFSSGFAEVGDAGAQAQQRLADKAREAGLRLLGPNCLGYMNLLRSVYATFTPIVNAGRLRAGDIGIVSQSGAFGAYAYGLARERDLGMSHWITTGNEADISFADCVEWLAHDPDTRVIMGYMEGCRDGFKLRRALATAQAARKPVVIVKVGRTALGAQAAASHTATLAGNDAVYDTIFREYGVHRARDITEFFGIAASASIAPALPAERSIGLFTVSGGVGVLMADEAADCALDVRPMPAGAQEQVRAWVPFANPVNPLDITGQVTNDNTLIERTADLMLREGGYANWIGFLAGAGTSATFWPVFEKLARDLRAKHPDRVLAVATLMPPERRRAIEAMRMLAFNEPVEAVRSIAALARFAEGFAAPGPFPQMPADAWVLPTGTQSEPQGLATLAAASIATIKHRLVHNADEAVAAAAEADGPVVLKVVSASITHKSDVGGVALGLSDATAVRSAYDCMLTTVAALAPGARIDGVLVAPMVSGGVECILGVQNDPVFGPMLMFGLGGVFVELLGDVALHSAPVTQAQALAMIRSVKGFRLLDGARGQAPVDLDFLAHNLVQLSQLAARAGDSLQSIDINPFIALPRKRGGGCAVDAVIVGRTPVCASDRT